MLVDQVDRDLIHCLATVWAIHAHAARSAASEDVVMAVVAGDGRADEPAIEDDSRNSDRGRGVVQAAFRPDVRARELKHRAGKPDIVRRHELDITQPARITPSDLDELSRMAIGERLPPVPEPCLVGVPDRLDVRLDDDAAAELATEVELGGRELDVRRYRLERLPCPALDVLGADVGPVAAAVQQARLGVAERYGDLLVASPDVVRAQPAKLIDDCDRT
jgi:hypothetical protein